MNSQSNIVYKNYKFIIINNIIYDKYLIKLLFERLYHVSLCLIKVEGGSSTFFFLNYISFNYALHKVYFYLWIAEDMYPKKKKKQLIIYKGMSW